MKTKKSARRLTVIFLTLAAIALMGSKADQPPPLMEWRPPPPGDKIAIAEGLDLDTLAALAESGVLQYFQPRREPGAWDVVSAMMIRAPADAVWEIATDHENLCQLLADTFDSCRTLSQKDDQTFMEYKLHTSVLRFSFNLELIDRITVTGPYSWRLETIKGHLKGRELELLLIPRGPDRTLAFLRYFGSMKNMNPLVKAVLEAIPDFEAPVYASACAYHLRSYKNAAERAAGYQPPPQYPPIAFSSLEPATLNQLCRWHAGLIRETPEGKVINAVAFASMDAPAELVWEVMTDFENYDDFFPDSTTVVEKRTDDEIILRQSTKLFNVLIFSFNFDLHSRYQLEKPSRMAWRAIDGTYADSNGEFVLVPYDDGQKTFVFATAEMVTHRDQGLTMKIVKSGAFPFDAMTNLFFCRNVLNRFNLEVDRRKRAAQ